ncbi:MAG: SAM-dependent methyltransferase [Enterobacterales bacterium]|jgi:SAM-dependent methyltransferase
MTIYTKEQLSAHHNLLLEKVFQVNTRWPQFTLLLNDIKKLAEESSETEKVVSLERGLLYGGISLFAPYFFKSNFISIDCSPKAADESGAYNKSLVDDPRLIKINSSRRASIENIGVEDDSVDLVVIPNLVHHVENQKKLFEEVSRIIKPGGKVYIFEAIVRELHQIPNDYIRYTPYGLSSILESVGLNVANCSHEGGPFSAISYCWEQALEYIPEEERKELERWYREEHFPMLMKFDNQYTENLVRKNSCFPVAFSVLAKK